MYYAFTPNSVFKSFASWLRTYLTNQYVILRYCCPNLYKWNYLYDDLPFYKIQVNNFMAQDEPFGAKIIPKCILWVRGLVPFWVLRHSFLSLTDCWWLYNIQLKTSRGVLFLPPSDAYVRSFLYLLYTLIKLYYTKALSDQASSLALDWILLLRRPRIPVSSRSATTFQWNLERWYWRIHLQGSNGKTDIENRFMDTGRGAERVRCMEGVTWKLKLPYVK